MLSNCIVSLSPVVHRRSVCHVSWGACEGSLACSGAGQRAVVAVAAEMALEIFFCLLLFICQGQIWFVLLLSLLRVRVI